jgi:hypothetical protein
MGYIIVTNSEISDSDGGGDGRSSCSSSKFCNFYHL